MNLYVIFDKVAEESGQIFEAKNDGVARRSMLKEWDKRGVSLSEFKLLRLGTIDHETCRVQVDEIPEEVSLEFGKAEVVE